MSYYDPFYPSIQATRLEIQRSFLALEQKLRLQREMDIDLPNHSAAMRAAAEGQLRYRNQIDASRFMTHVYDREINDRARYAREEENCNIKYISKIQQLQRQRLQLNQERAFSTLNNMKTSDYHRSPYKNISLQGNEEDQTLVKKYEDGTRARELKQDMIHNRNRFNSVATKSPFKTREFEDLDRTPYHNLSNSGEGKNQFSNQKLNRFLQNNKMQNRNRLEMVNNANYRQPHFGHAQDPATEQNSNKRGIQALSNNETRLNQNQIRENKVSHGVKFSENKHKSRHSPNRSDLGSSQRDRSPKSNQVATNRNRNPADRSRKLSPPQTSAMEKIEKRLKLSNVVYKDSKFKNIKHELSHLFNTYDCEFRLRRQLKQKINSHPLVLRKHAMVVQ